MTLGQLLSRFYNIVGDTKASPREFPIARVRSLLNDGCQVFRERVEDCWARASQVVTAGTSIYTIPDTMVRLKAIFFEDVYIPPATVMELQAESEIWRTKTATRPTRFTTDDVDHDEYRYYPTPDTTTGTGALSFNQDNGAVGAINKDGAFATFNQEAGILAYLSFATMQPEAGEVGAVVSTGVGQTTLWGVARPAPMSSDGDQVPIKAAFARAPLWYALSESYSEEGDHYEPHLATYYKARFDNEVTRAEELMSLMLQNQTIVLGGSSGFPTRSGLSQWPSQGTLEGVPTTIGWPRHAFDDECWE